MTPVAGVASLAVLAADAPVPTPSSTGGVLVLAITGVVSLLLSSVVGPYVTDAMDARRARRSAQRPAGAARDLEALDKALTVHEAVVAAQVDEIRRRLDRLEAAVRRETP